MKKTFICTVYCIAAIFLFAACLKKQPAAEIEPTAAPAGAPESVPETKEEDAVLLPIAFDELCEEANAKRQAANQKADISKYAEYLEKAEETLLTDREIKSLLSLDWKANKLELSIQEALADVDVLFRAYQDAYGPYYMFSEVLDGAKTQILNVLGEYSNTKIPRQEFADLIAYSLAENGFIDMHASVLNHTPATLGGQLYEAYFADGPVFSKDETGYYTVMDAKKWYASDADEKYMAVSTDEEGAIVYALVTLANQAAAPSQSEIVLHNKDGNSTTVQLNWTVGEQVDHAGKGDYNYTTKHGIPVISIRSMDYEAEEVAAFMENIDLSGAKAVVLDLRGNGGGNSTTADEWFFQLTGEYPHIKTESAMRASRLAKKAGAVGNDSEEGSWAIFEQDGNDSPIANDKVFFVLTDSGIMSAGETMISNLRSLDRVVFVGSNTRGGGIGLNRREFSLPQTGLWVTFPLGINFADNQEGKGFAPDIWVNPADALERTLAIADANGLSGDRYLALSVNEYRGAIGDTFAIACEAVGADGEDVAWSSSKDSIAAVDQNGNVTIVGGGTAVITASTKDSSMADTCMVSVEGPDTLSDEELGKICDLAALIEFGHSGVIVHSDVQRFLRYYYIANDGEGIDEELQCKTVSAETVNQLMLDSFGFIPPSTYEEFGVPGSDRIAHQDGTWYFRLSNSRMRVTAEPLRYEYLGNNEFEVRLKLNFPGDSDEVVYIAVRNGDSFYLSSIHWLN